MFTYFGSTGKGLNVVTENTILKGVWFIYFYFFTI